MTLKYDRRLDEESKKFSKKPLAFSMKLVYRGSVLFVVAEEYKLIVLTFPVLSTSR